MRYKVAKAKPIIKYERSSKREETLLEILRHNRTAKLSKETIRKLQEEGFNLLS